mmetsp:Transcript_11626/g.23828  ORF Transcript_11626/g.23828 Transcript_11626/m.23828 type:complete len:468 (-) Transcript_11626:867-2270(-)
MRVTRTTTAKTVRRVQRRRMTRKSPPRLLPLWSPQLLKSKTRPHLIRLVLVLDALRRMENRGVLFVEMTQSFLFAVFALAENAFVKTTKKSSFCVMNATRSTTFIVLILPYLLFLQKRNGTVLPVSLKKRNWQPNLPRDHRQGTKLGVHHLPTRRGRWVVLHRQMALEKWEGRQIRTDPEKWGDHQTQMGLEKLVVLERLIVPTLKHLGKLGARRILMGLEKWGDHQIQTGPGKWAAPERLIAPRRRVPEKWEGRHQLTGHAKLDALQIRTGREKLEGHRNRMVLEKLDDHRTQTVLERWGVRENQTKRKQQPRRKGLWRKLPPRLELRRAASEGVHQRTRTKRMQMCPAPNQRKVRRGENVGVRRRSKFQRNNRKRRSSRLKGLLTGDSCPQPQRKVAKPALGAKLTRKRQPKVTQRQSRQLRPKAILPLSNNHCLRLICLSLSAVVAERLNAARSMTKLTRVSSI